MADKVLLVCSSAPERVRKAMERFPRSQVKSGNPFASSEPARQTRITGRLGARTGLGWIIVPRPALVWCFLLARQNPGL
jgi:hypothetical protein